MSLFKVFHEPIVAIAPDGSPTPGTLTVIRVPDGFQAAIHCHDDLYATIHKNRTDDNHPLWNGDDAAFLQYVRQVYARNVSNGVSIAFDFVRDDVKAATNRRISDNLLQHMTRVALARRGGRPN